MIQQELHIYQQFATKKNFTANALISGGWSASMGIGAGLAGFVISEYGWETGLILDSVTFIIAAIVISTLPHGGPDPNERKTEVFSPCSEKYFLVGNLLSKGQKSVELCWQRGCGRLEVAHRYSY